MSGKANSPVRMRALAGVSRAGYYRHFEASAPRQEKTSVHDAIQRLALSNRHYFLRRKGFVVNHMREQASSRLVPLRAVRFPPYANRIFVDHADASPTSRAIGNTCRRVCRLERHPERAAIMLSVRLRSALRRQAKGKVIRTTAATNNIAEEIPKRSPNSPYIAGDSAPAPIVPV